MSRASVILDSKLIGKASTIGKGLHRSAPEQIERWVRIGKMMEDNPDLTYEFVKQVLVAKVERDSGELESYHLYL
jgi:hypothetical protein